MWQHSSRQRCNTLPACDLPPHKPIRFNCTVGRRSRNGEGFKKEVHQQAKAPRRNTSKKVTKKEARVRRKRNAAPGRRSTRRVAAVRNLAADAERKRKKPPLRKAAKRVVRKPPKRKRAAAKKVDAKRTAGRKELSTGAFGNPPRWATENPILVDLRRLFQVARLVQLVI